MNESKTALILGGGGARAAYQVGVLKAIAEFVPQGSKNPFPIVCGTSAGSINTVALASNASNFHEGVQKINHVWSNFELKQVFYVDAKNLFKRIFKWLWHSLGLGKSENGPSSLLDNQPLRELLNNYISFESYSSGESTTFFDGDANIEDWVRTHREGTRTKMSIDHLMASSAIPVIFPSVKLDDEYFGDGSMRQLSPVSPALHLGAQKILIIGLRLKDNKVDEKAAIKRPSLGEISGYVLDTLFLNSLQSDVERMERVNKLIAQKNNQDLNLKVIEHKIIYPSKDISDIALKHYKCLPRSFRIALKLLGLAKGNSRRFISYLMFSKTFCQEVIELGYQDALSQKTELVSFLAND